MNTKLFLEDTAVYLLTNHVDSSVDSIAEEIETNDRLNERVSYYLYDKNPIRVDEVQDHSDYESLLEDLSFVMNEITEGCYQNSIR